MALGMSAADIAVSSAGIENLKTQLQTRVDKAKEAADPTKPDFKALVAVIQKNWSGTDCTAFIKDLTAAANVLKDSVDSNYKMYKDALDRYLTEFKSMQQTIYKANKINISK